MHEWDRKLGQERRNILLLVDICPTQVRKGVVLRNIRREFLPRNTTSILQPCDLGMTRTAKVYCKQMARPVLHHIGDEKKKAAAVEMARKCRLLGAILVLTKAWSDVDASATRNCCDKGGLVVMPMAEAVVEPPRELNAPKFEEWLAIGECYTAGL